MRKAVNANFQSQVPGQPEKPVKHIDAGEQARTVDHLKGAGILPPDEKATDYPPLSAEAKRDIIATLMRTGEVALANEVATWASFKDAVPGNLADNTTPAGEKEQQRSVDYLKRAGILPESEKVKDYPSLAISERREILKVLLEAGRKDLAQQVFAAVTTAKTKKVVMSHVRDAIFALKNMANVDRQYAPALKAAEALMKMISKLS